MISVIIPVYNVDKYLDRCMNSILHQSYQNLQIICIDDGSNDQSAEILDGYAQKDLRVEVYHTSNQGVSAARNTALNKVRGEYFTFVDPDDWIEQEMLETMLNAIESTQADIASCTYSKDDGITCKKMENAVYVAEGVYGKNEFLKLMFMRDRYRAVGAYIWTRLFRTKVFLADGNRLSFDQDIYYGEGALFTTRAMMCSERVAYINKALYHYCQNEASATHNSERKLEGNGVLAAYERIIATLEDNEISTKTITYAKRFYAYWASSLVEDAQKANTHKYDATLKEAMDRYRFAYIRTNIRYPKRIIRFFKLRKWLET